MNDYLCPQCGQTYDLPGVCDVCGVDLQANDSDNPKGDRDELEDDDIGYDELEDDAETDPLADSFDEDEDDDDEFDDE